MDSEDGLQRFERHLAGLAMISVPVLLLTGFLLHPRFWSFDLARTPATLLASFRHQTGFHIGHLLVIAAVPPTLLMLFRIKAMLTRQGRSWGLWGAMIGGLGAVGLAVDKGALTLVLAGFDTLSDAQLAQSTPALQVIADRSGLLAITWLLVLLPIGAALQIVGLYREGRLPRRQAALTILGLLMLLNPDIEIISAAGALLMASGYLPLGLRELTAPRPAPTLTSPPVPATH
jgi:hypothetical protein